jgi:tetratricopeptide (TPR) repeat protein
LLSFVKNSIQRKVDSANANSSLKKFKFILVILCALCANAFAQSHNMDSLNAALQNAKHDSERVFIYLTLGANKYGHFPDSAIVIWEKAKSICETKIKTLTEKSREQKVMKLLYASAINNIATAYHRMNGSTRSIEYFNLSLKIREELGDKRGVAESHYNIAGIYSSLGKPAQALVHLEEALKLSQELDDKPMIASCFGGLGNAYNDLGDRLKALDFHQKSVRMKEDLGDKTGLAISLNNIATTYEGLGNITKALEYNHRALKIREEVGDPNYIAVSLNNIGSLYHNRGDVAKALEYLGRSLKLLEQAKNKLGVAAALNNIALIYREQGDVTKTLEYFGKSLKLLEEIEDKKGVATLLTNIGDMYHRNGDPSVTSSVEDAHHAGLLKALDHFNRSLQLREESGNKKGIAESLSHIGGIYQTDGDPGVRSSKAEAMAAGIPIALQYFTRSLKIQEEIGEKNGAASSYINIAKVYLAQKKYAQALSYANKSMLVSKELGFPKNIKVAAELIYAICKTTGDNKTALENYELAIRMRDSVSNETNRKASIKNQLKYEYEKQAAADSVAFAKEGEIKNVELKRQSVEIKAKKNQQYALFGGLFLVVLFSIFMYNRFKVTQKQKVLIEHQKEIVEEQKKLVEEKQREVLESIHYAKRIQMAQIPSEKMVIGLLGRTKK